MAERSGPPGHVFISYVRENSRDVERIKQRLQSAGIRVWRDVDELGPGEDWPTKIRDAISKDALVFIACFSKESIARHKSYQLEELNIAIDEMRKRYPDEPWLIPVRLDDCDIPALHIGGNRWLASIQRVDLFGPAADDGAKRLIDAVRRILTRDSGIASPISAQDRLGLGRSPTAQPGRLVSAGEPLQQSASWHERVNSRRQPTIEGLVSPNEASTGAGIAAVTALIVWTTLATMLAYFYEPHPWLGIAAASGFISLLAVRHDEFEFREVPLTIPMLIIMLISYGITAYFFLGGWLARGFIIGITLLYIPIAIGRDYRMLSVWSADYSYDSRRRQDQIMADVKRRRWIFGSASDSPNSELLNQLADMPAARFACISNSCFSFMVVVGDYVELVALIEWPPGVYARLQDSLPNEIRRNGQPFLAATDNLSKIAREADEWRTRLTEVELRFIIVVQPTYSPGRVVLDIGDYSRDIMFATWENFADVAGSFLVEKAYIFNVPTLEKVLSYLDRRTHWAS